MLARQFRAAQFTTLHHRGALTHEPSQHRESTLRISDFGIRIWNFRLVLLLDIHFEYSLPDLDVLKSELRNSQSEILLVLARGQCYTRASLFKQQRERLEMQTRLIQPS